MHFAQVAQTIRSSLYDPLFYSGARSHPLSSPLSVLGILGVLAIGLSLGIAYSSSLVPFALSSFPERLVSAYPADLVVTFGSGIVTTNQPAPYYVANPITKDMLGTSTPKYLTIFDTDDKLGIDLQQNDTYALVKKTYVIAPDNNGGGDRITTFSKEDGTTTVSRADVAGFVAKLKPYFAPVLIIGGFVLVLLGIVVGTFFWLVFHCLYMFLPAALLWFFMYLRNTKTTYGESYVLALYASIPVAIISFLLTLLGLPLPGMTYTLLLLIVAIVNLTHRPITQSQP